MAWQRAASLGDLGSARSWLPVSVGSVDLIIAGADGGWYAFEDRCAHAGCAFSEDGELDGSRVICNCHGSEFQLQTGAVRRGPAERPIRTFPVRIAGDAVEVDL
jgi:nitrite reductase/ring-hydroxylating ferredoxin subunit